MAHYRFGLFCSLADNSLSTNRTCTLQTLCFESVLAKTKQNAKELIELLDFAKERGLTTFRLGNSFIPFISHPNFNTTWLQHLEYILDETREKLKDFDIRITQHPGQYTVLNSPHKEVVQNSLKELQSSFWLFEKLGIDAEGIILIHGGGAYGNKEEALERLCGVVAQNSWLKERLALENDEKIYTAKEIVQTCLHVKIPFVFDIYHHSLNPSEFLVEDFLESYGARRAKVHLSSKGEGRFGNHGDFIEVEDFRALEKLFGEKLYEIDIMVEAKQKERAILRLQESILDKI